MPASTTWRTSSAAVERRLRHATPLAAVLLDLDGTLLDTAPDMVRIANQLRAADQLPPLPLADLRLQVSHGSAAVLRAAFPGIEPLRLASCRTASWSSTAHTSRSKRGCFRDSRQYWRRSRAIASRGV